MEVMNKARKVVEGPKRKVPFSQKKAVSRATVLYQKAKVNLLKDRNSSKEKIDMIRRIAEIEN